MARGKQSTFERLQKKCRLSHSERKELARKLASEEPDLRVVHPDAAGIDVGNESHFASVPAGRDPLPVQEFGSWTKDLWRMADWLKQRGIKTVAMQSTGVYWMSVLEVLEQAGLEVYLVNARGTKNLPGRKSDVQECEWLRKLHTYGLLRNSFRPPAEIEGVRTVWRQRERVVQEAATAVQQMQKALTKMNVQLANAISDISGQTGMAIIRAIVGGEREPRVLAKFRDPRIRASEEEIAHSLEGNWREDLVWELKQVLAAYDFHQQQLASCDEKLQQCMKGLPDRAGVGGGAEEGQASEPGAQKRRRAKQRHKSKNQPEFDLGAELRRTMGVDLTQIDGINVMTAQTILAEIGPDVSAFPSEGNFSSWLMLAPWRDVSGGKVIRQPARRGQNRVANALRMAAQSLQRSETYLGAKYRQLRSRLDGVKAVKAMARYLACLVYRLLRYGQEWVDRGSAYYESKRQEREVKGLQRKAAALGLRLVATV